MDKLIESYNRVSFLGVLEEIPEDDDTCDRPCHHTPEETGAATVEFGDIPLQWLPHAGNAPVTWALDVLDDQKITIDFKDVKAFMAAGDYAALPGLLRPKTNDLPVTMELYITETAPDTYTIIKLMHFPTRPKAAIVRRDVLQGSGYIPTWTQDRIRTNKVIHDMLGRLGGNQFRYRRWRAPKSASVNNEKKGDAGPRRHLMSEDEIDTAFDFIKKHAPRSNKDSKQSKFILKQLNNPDSPCFHMSKADIQGAISDIRNEQVHAETMGYYGLCFSDLSPWAQKTIKSMLPSLLKKGLLLIGEPGWAKTPVLTIISMAMSRYHKRRLKREFSKFGQYRTTPDLDFLKDEAGVLDIPVIFDDGDLRRA